MVMRKYKNLFIFHGEVCVSKVQRYFYRTNVMAAVVERHYTAIRSSKCAYSFCVYLFSSVNHTVQEQVEFFVLSYAIYVISIAYWKQIVSFGNRAF